MEEAKKMKCYKRLIYKQFVQNSGVCGPQFLSYLPKRFTHGEPFDDVTVKTINMRSLLFLVITIRFVSCKVRLLTQALHVHIPATKIHP